MKPVLKTRLQTNVFQIDAKFSDSELKISLRDYSDWIVYKKLYTNEDIGKQINRKVDLKQIFYSFNKAMESKSVPQKYEFGTMISQIGLNLFKVQQNGRIIVSVNRFEKVNNQFKQTDELSYLNLIKHRDMAQNQIITMKMKVKMENTYDQFIKQLSQINENKKVLEDKVSSLEANLAKEEAKRKAETKKLDEEKKMLQDKVTFLAKILIHQQTQRKAEIKKIGEEKKMLQEKLAAFTVNLKKEETKRKEEVKKLEDQQKKLQNSLNILVISLAKEKEERRAETNKLSDHERLLEKITPLASLISKVDRESKEEAKKHIDQKKILQDNLKGLSVRLENEESQRKADIKKLSDEARLLQDKFATNSFTQSVPRMYQILEGPTTKNYKIQKNSIEYIANFMSQLIINQKIPTKANFTFKIKLIKTTNKYIMIGLIDVLKQKSATTSYGSNNAVAYYCSNGNKYPALGAQGGGVSQGETAEISVNLQAKTMKVLVNGALRATVTHSMLAQPTRLFLPYIQMNTLGDIVQWVQ